MICRHARLSTLITWLLILMPPIILFAPALRPDYALLPTSLPYQIDPLWQALAPKPTLTIANPVLSDQFYQYHAWKTALWRSLAQGEFAWWTPAINGGQTLLSNGQVGLLDPFNLVGMLFPLTVSYVVGALLRLWVAGGFTYLYARTIGLSHHAAWLSLLTFTLSGLLVSWVGATPSHVFVWFPALLWMGEKLLTTRRTVWGLASAIMVAVLLFSSQPEIAFQVGIAWGIYLLVRAVWLEGGLGRGLRRHARWWLVIVLLGIALAAIEILPFIAALRESVVFNHRADSLQLGTTAWLRRIMLSWQAWPTVVTVLLPSFLGREQDESYWYPLGNSLENNAYAGVLPLLLAMLALWAAWRNQAGTARRWLWLWGGLGFGALALAVELPVFKGINDLPPFNLAAPGRWRGIYVFAVAILAGFGLDLLFTQTHLRRTLLFLIAGAAAVNLALVAAAYIGFTLFSEQLIATGRAFMEANVGSPMLDRPLDELYTLVEIRQQAKLAMLMPTNPIMFLPLLGAGLFGLLWLLHHKWRISWAWITPILIAITWLDLMVTGMGINRAMPTAWLEPTPPAVEFLQRQPAPMRVVGTHLILNPNMALLTRLEDVRGYDPIASSRYQALLAGLEGYVASGYHHFFRNLDDTRLDLFNATYGLSRTPPNDPRWEAVFADPSGVTVYRSHSVLPRAYLVYAAEVVDSPEQSLAHTLDPAFDAHRSVVLETIPATWTPPTSTISASPQVEFSARQATTIELTVATPVPALLVLLETYAEGWHATIDRQPTPIYRANHAFRAVVVPAGQHTVAFAYTPPLLRLGIAISGYAWIVVLGLLLWLRFRKQAKGQQP